jgi:5-methyltetrahydrofolate--homocysteine methyltransferase
MSDKLAELLADLKENEVTELVEKSIADGIDPMEILSSARSGMQIVGDRFADGTYFIPDLIFSGEILKSIAEKIEPLLKASGPTQKKGVIVFGTVAGDIHDIGKDIVSFMLDISGYEVHDLGIDVPVQTFVDKIKETGATIVGLSGFLTLAFDAMKETIDAITAAGLRDSVKIMIGGGQIDEQVCKHTGADAYGRDAMEAVKLADQWANA